MRYWALLLLLVLGALRQAQGAPSPSRGASARGSARQYAGSFEVTAYCSCPLCCGRNAQGVTASGRPAAWGAVAADWGVLAPGTRIELSCYPGQAFTVLDTGSAIKGRRLDVWQPDHETAREFGRQRRVRVWILDHPGEGGLARPQLAAHSAARPRAYGGVSSSRSPLLTSAQPAIP